MVRTCDYPDCTNKNVAHSPHTFQRFPVADVALRRLWLVALGFNVNTKLAKIRKLRVCSAHFSDDDYVPSYPGQRKKHVLKSTAVPAPHACTPAAMAAAARSGGSTDSIPDEVDRAFSGRPQPTPLKCRFDHEHWKMVLTGPPETAPKTKPSTSGTYLALPSTWAQPQSENPSSTVASESLDTSMSSTEAPCEGHGGTFPPLSSECTSPRSSSSDVSIVGAERRGDWSERKWIVNESALMELFSTCHTCGVAITDKKITSCGPKIKIEWTCLNRHTGVWQSCPDVRGIPENDLVSSAAVIFTGTAQNEVAEWADLLNLQLPKKTSYDSPQSTSMMPVIHEANADTRDKNLAELQGAAPHGGRSDVGGDARSDSQGYGAKYTCYSFTDDASKKVSETTSSPAMESVGFQRGLDRLLDSGVGVDDVVTTDRAPSIRKIMRESCPELRHQFDPWHVAEDAVLDYVVKEEDCSDQQLYKQESDSSLDQKEQEPLQMEEEQQELVNRLVIKEETLQLGIDEQEEQLVLKQETEDTFIVTPTLVEKCHIKPEPVKDQVISPDSNETKNQDEDGHHHKDSGSKRDNGTQPKRTSQKATKSNSSEPKRRKKTRKENSLYSCNLNQHLTRLTGEKPFRCLSCGKTFTKKSHFDAHIRVHKGEKPFSCTLCGKYFTRKSYLTSHMVGHTDRKPFPCNICDKTFRTKQVLKRHIMVHKGEKHFLCTICGKGFTLRSSLSSHMIGHTDNKPFSCDTCEKTFKRKQELKQHIMTHTGEKHFFCTFCGKGFSQRSHLNRHMMVHTQPFCCTICGKGFSQRGQLNYHLRLHTGERPFPCDVCHKAFRSKNTLNQHMMVHTGEKPFLCTICGKGFSHKSSLTTHTVVHTDNRHFPCNVCEKTFRTNQVLKRHMRVHTDEKSLCCTTCGKSFTTKNNLNRHLRAHAVETPFPCNICDKTFYSKQSLNEHMRDHTGVRQLKCPSCGKSFTRKGRLDAHIRIHTGEKPFSCTTCGKGFTSKCNLNSHMKLHAD